MMFRHHWIPALDAIALADAQTRLGLRDPVRIEVRADGGFPEAFYRRDEGVNIIGLNPLQCVRELSRSLWHEMQHAQQCEGLFDGDGAEFHAEAFRQAIDFDVTGIIGPLETEAISAEDFDYDNRLIRMVKI